MKTNIIVGDSREVLKTLPDESVQCVITSPPYWGLRDYGVSGQMGLEPSPQEYVAQMVELFREVRRVLRSDGTVWLNLGDTYFGSGGAGGDYAEGGLKEGQPKFRAGREGANLKPKDLIGVPWRVALALQDDGWWLRSDIIWAKPNPMPESVTDRPARSHEYIFLLTKNARYYYDHEAVKVAQTPETLKRYEYAFATAEQNTDGRGGYLSTKRNTKLKELTAETGANLRDVWNIATHAYSDAHFATFPPKLIEPCVKAGTKIGDTILDPFNGAGTTGLVAHRLERDYIGIELNPEYAEMARKRIYNDAPLLQIGQEP